MQVSVPEDKDALRDFFAMVALQGIISASSAVYSFDAKGDSILAYDYADALMARRDKSREK